MLPAGGLPPAQTLITNFVLSLSSGLDMLYIYIIYPPPHFARRVWPGSKLCFPIFAIRLLLIAYNRASSNSDGNGLAKFHPPPGRPLQTSVLLYVLSNIAYFATWIHHIIHQNLIFCTTSLLIFTFSLSCKSITFRSSLKNITKRESDNHQIPIVFVWFPSLWDPKIHLPNSTFRSCVFFIFDKGSTCKSSISISITHEFTSLFRTGDVNENHEKRWKPQGPFVSSKIVQET